MDGTRVPSNPTRLAGAPADMPAEAARIVAAAMRLRTEQEVTFVRHKFGLRIHGRRWELGLEKCCCAVSALLIVDKVEVKKLGKDVRGAYQTARGDAADHLGVPMRRLDAFIAGYDRTDSPTEDPEQVRWVAAGKYAATLLLGAGA